MTVPGSRYKTSCVEVPWSGSVSTSSTVTAKKSTFIAYATSLSNNNPQSIYEFLAHLNSSPHFNIKRASHLIHAYLMVDPISTGSNDGGEHGAGERLENLLKLRCSGKSAVIVAVVRWYGGVKLGNDRWKCISKVAKEALDTGGFS
ncbi:hypothetical protein HWV62_29372 [Athelia sp. TMB]|nr:hypothetical protein HWV62_29372 [Athelia sp. TMB]